MRIGFFTDRYLPQTDGITVSVESFRRALEDLGHEVYVFAPAVGKKPAHESERIIRFRSLKGVMFEEYYASYFFPPQAIRKIERLNLDIIHFHSPSPLGLLGFYVAVRNHIPLVTTYHTDLIAYSSQYPAFFPWALFVTMISPLLTGRGSQDIQSVMKALRPQRRISDWNGTIVRQVMPLLMSECARTIAPSRKIEQELHSWDPQARITILPTGVDKITTKTAEINRFRQSYGLDKDDLVILFVGRLGPEKNVTLLIRAFARLAKRIPSATLVLVGDHPQRDELEELITTLAIESRVVITGYMKHQDLGAAYEASDIFAFPSVTDTQGLVLNEAAHAGLPIVLTDATITEVAQDRVNALVAKPAVSDLSDKLTTLLQDTRLRQKMGAASRHLAANFTTTKQAAKLSRLYEQISKSKQA